MLKRCIYLFGLPRRKNVEGGSTSFNFCSQSNDFAVRIVHAGGKEELYRNTVHAAQLMEKYPGLCVARPEVFRNPHKSLIWPEEKLLPGHKYYLIPCTTARKLMHRLPKKVEEKGPSEGSGSLNVNIVDGYDSSDCPAKNFYTSKERWSIWLLRRSGEKKRSTLPPLAKEKLNRGLGWEPSLDSIQELSP